MTITGDQLKSAVLDDRGQKGTAALTAVMIMGLLALFTAASLSRVTTEALMMGNDHSNTVAFYAAQASLEQMSRNFNKVFDLRLNLTTADIANIQSTTPNISGFGFVQTVTQTAAGEPRTIEDGQFSGLISIRDPWRLDATATYANGAEVRLTRTFFNHRIPIFQFGIFYDDDMEFHPGPHFAFGGRVHSNSHIYMAAGGGGLDFESRVTSAGEIVRDTSRKGISRGDAGWSWNGVVQIKDNLGTLQTLDFGRGSVIRGPDILDLVDDNPDGDPNLNWTTDSALFGGNLRARANALRLPLQIGGADPVELVKRGVPGEDEILAGSRYFNKPGIRVSLADSQARLPGGVGGVRLDGRADGTAADPTALDIRGYQPVAMGDGFIATRFNGFRAYSGANYPDAGEPLTRQTWIKVELVDIDSATLATVTRDITPEILSLGLTDESIPAGAAGQFSFATAKQDRAIIKMQRYLIAGPPIKVAPADINNTNVTPWATKLNDARTGTVKPAYSYIPVSATSGFNVVTADLSLRWQDQPVAVTPQGSLSPVTSGGTIIAGNAYLDNLETGHDRLVSIKPTATAPAVVTRVVPLPIEMYDVREGLYNESIAATGAAPSWEALYTTDGANTAGTVARNSKVPHTGIMSIIDIDMQNLGRLLRGDWDGLFPANATLPGNSLSIDDISNNGGSGVIFYVSDRRGDRDNDGIYDMEDIFGPNDGNLDIAEDINRDAVLQADYQWESARYNESIETDLAATRDHKYFRRGVRVINGATLFGTINLGYAVASENGVYVLGNFNATGLDATAPNNPSPPSKYLGPEVPASFSADSVAFLSREWNDAKSFRSPFRHGTRVISSAATGETTVRAALLTGDTRSKLDSLPNQGGGDASLSGGVHNFIRFLENWGAVRVNYAGSLINLFNSRVNNGAHKNGGNTYSPPIRNWAFDTAFLDANRLPPGTPFFQFVQMTGFRQTIRQQQ